jgi:hypothetical protein
MVDIKIFSRGRRCTARMIGGRRYRKGSFPRTGKNVMKSYWLGKLG